MLRLAVIIVAIAGAAVFSSVALAQSPEPPLPVAGPDEIIFVGEVPAPPGTEVTIEYLAIDAPEINLCATAITTPTAADAESSSFVLVVEASCAQSPVEPRICWGADLCYFAFVPPGGDRHKSGDTIDLARLVPQGPPEVGFPTVGGGGGRDNQERLSWLVWAGAALLLAGVISGGASIVLRRKT